MPPKATRAKKTRKARENSREAWIWKNVAADHISLLTIDPTQLDPPTTPVTSASNSELVCSYNWLTGDKLAIKAPGFAPTWKPPPMPTTVPPDTGSFYIDHNGARMPCFPFEPLFRATAIVNPDLCFDKVDIVINRNSLRKLLDLCRGRVEASFRLELLQVGNTNTLVVERCERKVREKLRGGNLISTHRAGYLQPQTTMAEIKSAKERKGLAISKHMPQLWFGRTPWLLVGHHTDGTFHNVSSMHVASHFATWDAKDTNQAALRTLSTLLARLRDDVLQQRLCRGPGTDSGYFVAVCEKQSSPHTIQIFAPAKGKKQALPDDLISHFWSSPV